MMNGIATETGAELKTIRIFVCSSGDMIPERRVALRVIEAINRVALGEVRDATTGQEITRIVLHASVTGLNVHKGMIALGDALGRIQVFDGEEFLTGKGSASG
jgi:hypothetical protein